MAAPEEFAEHFFKIIFYLIEALFKCPGDRPVQLVYDRNEFVHCLNHILPLLCQELIAFVHLLVFFYGAYIDVAQFPQFFTDPAAFADAGGHGEMILLVIHGLGIGYLKLIPEFVLQIIHLGLVLR